MSLTRRAIEGGRLALVHHLAANIAREFIIAILGDTAHDRLGRG